MCYPCNHIFVLLPLIAARYFRKTTVLTSYSLAVRSRKINKEDMHCLQEFNDIFQVIKKIHLQTKPS